jgi:hypothetical protein
MEKALGKLADFDHLYDSGDPRAYFRGLAPFGYEIPHHGQRVFRQVMAALDATDPLVVDLCCSYGVNAALLKHDLTLRDLYAHYCSPLVRDLSIEELTDLDRQYFAARRLPAAPRVVGVDAAGAAVGYGLDVGLLDMGFELDLEHAEPSAPRAAVLGQADLVVVTGGVGYITETTFDRLLACVPTTRLPWVVALCLRTVSFQPIADLLAERGLVTEQLHGVTFPQRRFVDQAEQAHALERLAALDVDPHERETDGRYHCDVYLARPADDTVDSTIRDILGELADPEGAPVP